jgi:hypothetical protein
MNLRTKVVATRGIFSQKEEMWFQNLVVAPKKHFSQQKKDE